MNFNETSQHTSFSCYKINREEPNRVTILPSFFISLDKIKREIEDFNIREIYIIDEKYRFDISSIVLKPNCILLKLDIIRVVIFPKMAYLIDSKNNEFQNILPNIKNSIEESESKLTSNTQFNLHIFDILLNEISNYFFKIINDITQKILKNNMKLRGNIVSEYASIDIENGNLQNNQKSNSENDCKTIGSNEMKYFFTLQSNLINIEYRLKELKNIMEELKDNDDNILFTSEINIVNRMIENYLFKFQDLENDIGRVTRDMDNLQKIININLANQRNLYAKHNLKVSTISVSISIGSLITGIFGMNLNNHLEDNSIAFFLCILLLFIVNMIMYRYIRYESNAF